MSRIFKKINIARRRRDAVATLRTFLKPGKYFFFKDVKIVFHSKLDTNTLFSYFDIKCNFFHRIFIFLLNIFFSVKITGNGSYELVYFNHKNEIKLFDFSGSTLMYNISEKEITRHHELDSFFSSYLCVPKYTYITNCQFNIIEEIIRGTRISSLDVDKCKYAFVKLVQYYEKYFEKCFLKKEYKKNLNFIMVRQHGDLSSTNIIFSLSEDVYVIDWEHLDFYTLFYDIFFLLTNNLVVYNNKYLLMKECIECLVYSINKITSLYSLDVNASKMYLIFINEFSKLRLNPSNSQVVRRYNQAFEEIYQRLSE